MTTLGGLPALEKKDSGAKAKKRKKHKPKKGNAGASALPLATPAKTYAPITDRGEPTYNHNAQGKGVVRKKKNMRKKRTKAASPGDYRSSDDEYDSEDEDEGASGYRVGGYHPVRIGEMYNRRYRIVKKLGWGHFSTVWLAVDHLNDSYVALKIVKSAPRYTEAADDEIELLLAANGKEAEGGGGGGGGKRAARAKPADGPPRLDGRAHVVRLLDHFRHKGPNGKHVVMVFEVLGDNFLSLVESRGYAGLPIPVVKSIAKQLLMGVEYLHTACNIIHTDLKLENLLVVDPAREPSAAVETRHMPRNHQAGGANGHCAVNGDGDVDGGEAAADAASSVCNGANGHGSNGAHMEAGEGGGGRPVPGSPMAVEEDSGADSDAHHGGQNGDAADGRVLEAAMDTEGSPSDDEAALDARQWPEFTNVKIADLGNACWVDHHFTSDVQTRQYRAPEVIVGAPYGPAIDVWSVACIIFELLTGDLLFKPKTGSNYEKEDDHLALILELIGGRFPRRLLVEGIHSRRYFDRAGKLRAIKEMRPWLLADVLHEKYKFEKGVAEELSAFLLPMLQINPHQRASAQQALEHEWLHDADLSVRISCVEENAARKKIADARKRRQRLKHEMAKAMSESDSSPDGAANGDGRRRSLAPGVSEESDEPRLGEHFGRAANRTVSDHTHTSSTDALQ